MASTGPYRLLDGATHLVEEIRRTERFVDDWELAAAERGDVIVGIPDMNSMRVGRRARIHLAMSVPVIHGITMSVRTSAIGASFRSKSAMASSGRLASSTR